MRELCRRALPRKYCPSSTTKGFSTTSLMIIMALYRVGDPLPTNREKIEISRAFMETLVFKILVGDARDGLITVQCLGRDC